MAVTSLFCANLRLPAPAWGILFRPCYQIHAAQGAGCHVFVMSGAHRVTQGDT
jgi:hypothetical protein